MSGAERWERVRFHVCTSGSRRPFAVELHEVHAPLLRAPPGSAANRGRLIQARSPERGAVVKGGGDVTATTERE